MLLTTTALLKLQQHLLKHSHCGPVVGVCLGKNKNNNNNNNIIITDVLPLFHNLPIQPMVAVARLQTEAVVKQTNGAVIGVYIASNNAYTAAEKDSHAYSYLRPFLPLINEFSNNNTKSLFLLQFSSSSLNLYGHATDITATINDKKEADWMRCIELLQSSSSKWSLNTISACSTTLKLHSTLSSDDDPLSSLHSQLLHFIVNEAYRDVNDFEDHLNDVSKDWSNGLLSTATAKS